VVSAGLAAAGGKARTHQTERVAAGEEES